MGPVHPARPVRGFVMEQMHLIRLDPLVPPACEMCGFDMRLVGLEPHPTHQQSDVCTYQCNSCGAVQTRDTPRIRVNNSGGR
jgi:hypothetical protein